MRWTSSALSMALLFSACDGRPLELSVDVRTDFTPGTEFQTVRVVLVSPGEQAVERSVSAGISESFLEGRRVAEFTGLSPGEHELDVSLRDASGAEVISRRVVIDLYADWAATVRLFSSCQGVNCLIGGPPDRTECLDGVCVSPRCGTPESEGCGPLTCVTSAECGAVLTNCAAPRCEHGLCVCDGPARDGGGEPPLDGGPPPPTDAGPEDAGSPGPCPGACAPGETDTGTRACGQCDEGTQERTRTCTMECTWGEWGSYGTCETNAQCTPGQTQSQSESCGNCGTRSRTRTCSSSTCRWGSYGDWSACGGQGACSPGGTRACPNGDPCGHQVCSSSCSWGSCTPAPGNACLRIRPGTSGPVGNNFRCCGSSRWQFCLSSCQWSPDCEPCSGCGC